MSDNAAARLVRAYYDAFNDRDRVAMLDLLADDVVHDVNQGSSEVGIEAFRIFLAHMDDCYEEQVEDLVIMTEPSGTLAAAEFFIRGRYVLTDKGLPEATGQPYRLRVGAFFENRGGKIARVTNYYNLEDWVRQVVQA